LARTAQAKRYAQAVFQIAQQTQELDRWLSDLQTLAGLDHNDIFVKALETPNLTFNDQGRLLADRFPRISPLAINLVCLLVQRRRIIVLPAVFEEYRRLLDSHRGIERAEVVTAVPLDDAERRQIEERLEAISGKRMTVTAKVDPAVIGGVIARFGGRLLDGSTRSRLEALKKEIGHIPR
jgi:F-type H+-transporting ATPase subunit delta